MIIFLLLSSLVPCLGRLKLFAVLGGCVLFTNVTIWKNRNLDVNISNIHVPQCISSHGLFAPGFTQYCSPSEGVFWSGRGHRPQPLVTFPKIRILWAGRVWPNGTCFGGTSSRFFLGEGLGCWVLRVLWHFYPKHGHMGLLRRTGTVMDPSSHPAHGTIFAPPKRSRFFIMSASHRQDHTPSGGLWFAPVLQNLDHKIHSYRAHFQVIFAFRMSPRVLLNTNTLRVLFGVCEAPASDHGGVNEWISERPSFRSLWLQGVCPALDAGGWGEATCSMPSVHFIRVMCVAPRMWRCPQTQKIRDRTRGIHTVMSEIRHAAETRFCSRL